MKVTLIYPIYNESHRIENSMQDLASFFGKFPVNPEIIFVLDPDAKKDHEITKQRILQNNICEKFQVQLIVNEKFLGRGASQRLGLSKAQGDVLILGSIDFNIPLGEYLGLLQEFHTNPNLELVSGLRNTSKKPRSGPRNKWVSFFESMEQDRYLQLGLQLNDRTSPLVALKKPALQKISSQLRKKKWFFISEILWQAQQHNCTMLELPVMSRDTEETRFKWWYFFL